MKLKGTCICYLVFACVMSIALTVQSAPFPGHEDELAIIKQLDGLDETQCEAALSKLSLRRAEMQRELITVLNTSHSESVEAASAYLIGLYRMDGAVKALAESIRLKTKNILQDRESLIGAYPAFDALIAIGSPSIPALIENLAESDDSLVRELSLRAVCRIDRDNSIVEIRLNKALNAENDSGKQKRLHTAIRALGG